MNFSLIFLFFFFFFFFFSFSFSISFASPLPHFSDSDTIDVANSYPHPRPLPKHSQINPNPYPSTSFNTHTSSSISHPHPISHTTQPIQFTPLPSPSHNSPLGVPVWLESIARLFGISANPTATPFVSTPSLSPTSAPSPTPRTVPTQTPEDAPLSTADVRDLLHLFRRMFSAMERQLNEPSSTRLLPDVHASLADADALNRRRDVERRTPPPPDGADADDQIEDDGDIDVDAVGVPIGSPAYDSRKRLLRTLHAIKMSNNYKSARTITHPILE